MIFSEKGQSLIDIVISLGLLLVIISALSIATINGLRNSQFSRNQIQATKRAQDAMEQIRSIKANNYGVCINTNGPVGCGLWSDIWSRTMGVSGSCTDCRFRLLTTPAQAACQATGNALKPICLIESSSLDTLSNGFKQDIFVEDEKAAGVKVPNQLKITVKVSWTDTSGTHESVLATILSKY